MTDHRQELSRTVEELHRQLQGIQPLDPSARVTLESALDDILEALAKPGADAAQPHSLADKLREAAAHFQESHPGLFNGLTGIIEALARMGI